MYQDPKMPDSADEKAGPYEDGRNASAASDPIALEAALVDADQFGQTRRGLKSRHIQLIALGGAIGTGLFVGSGAFPMLHGLARHRQTWKPVFDSN